MAERIKEKWDEYSSQVLSEIEEPLHEFAEPVFFAGGTAVFGLLQDLLSSSSSGEEVAEALEDMHKELVKYGEPAPLDPL